MRFDLEIPAITSTQLVYVPDGEEINSSLVPLSYYSLNTKNMFIEDFITSENAFSAREFLADGYEVKQGPAFSISSDKLLITHISKFIPKEGIQIPLFYKHTINQSVTADVIKIYDYYNTEISSDNYIVETFKDKTYIYMNKTDSILFAEWASGVGFTKTILDLAPVFQEATWESLAIRGTIGDFEYMIDGDSIKTTYSGQLFVSFINNIRLFKNPVGNIDDPWYVNILNSNFITERDGVLYRYTTPEYYRQRFDGDGNIKKVVEKKCKNIFAEVVKSQYTISRRMYDSVFVYVRDYYTNELKYAFTSNSFLIDTLYENDIYYAKLNDVSSEGYIMLPVQLSSNDVVYATHFTEDDYCEYTQFNINSLASNQNNYCALYLKPNVRDTENGAGHKTIGDGGDFGSYEDYQEFILQNKYLHVALISATAYFDESFINTYDVRQQGETIKDKYSVCKSDIDLVYGEIINGNLVIPTNDALVAKLDTTRLIEENRFSFNEDGTQVNTTKFIDKIKDVLDKNLDVSTKSIIEINPPTN